MEIKLPLV